MGFKLKKLIPRGIAAISTGGLSEVARKAGISGGLVPDQLEQSQVPLLTEEQRAAQRALLDFSKTGKWGDFTAGADLGLGQGDFNTTQQEDEGLSQLRALLSSNLPEQFSQGNAALKDILNPDPNFVQSQFDPFKAQTQRLIDDSVNASKRSSAYSGNLYSTGAMKNLGDVRARGNETLAGKLAELTNSALNRRLQAVPLAFQAGQAEEDLRLGRIGASQQYGGLTRNLNNARTAAREAEILRRRQELQMPIDAARTLSGQNAQFGVPSVTTSQPSSLMQMLQLLVHGGSTFFGARG